jgi:tRNA G46 methylase TrmB
MEQTPINLAANGDVLLVMPRGAHRIIEVGCSGGGLAREYRAINPRCEYIGIEINETYAAVACAHCTRVIVADIERMSDEVFESLAGSACWIFGDVLEHLYDPWAVLRPG